jgi:DNA-binding HxlR family transcriptional regulator
MMKMMMKMMTTEAMREITLTMKVINQKMTEMRRNGRVEKEKIHGQGLLPEIF